MCVPSLRFSLTRERRRRSVACRNRTMRGQHGQGGGKQSLNTMSRQPGVTALELPTTAPIIRLTAGAGSAGQKTWNIRRPVTLIGSCRPAQIVLHDEGISKAHCVIVNTGKEVLVKDLHTSLGTRRGDDRFDLAILQDGDVLSIGKTRIQVAIRMPTDENDDSGCGVEYVEPVKFSKPVFVRLEHTDQQWRVEEAVALIGRHGRADIRVDHPRVSSRHAILFKFANAPAIFDIGGREGIRVNGEACTVSGLQIHDRIAVGSCVLSIESTSSVDGDGLSTTEHGPKACTVEDASVVTTFPPVAELSSAGTACDAELSLVETATPIKAIADCLVSSRAAGDSSAALAKIESELETLQHAIDGSWGRVNAWEQRLDDDKNRLDRRKTSVEAREAEVEGKDAALRGRLHDLTRFHEQIAEREKELAAQLANIQDQQDCAARADVELGEREAQIVRRMDELRSREHVLAQRWARLQASNCPHCGKPFRSPSAGLPAN